MGLVGPVVMLVWCMAAYYGFGRSSGYAGMVYGSLLWVSLVIMQHPVSAMLSNHTI